MEGLFIPSVTVAYEVAAGGDGLTNSVNRQHTSDSESLESEGRESIDTEWTNEKHSLYLKSMEASFVNQLYNSLDLSGSCLQEDYSADLKSSRQMHTSTRTPSGRFKVLIHGNWERVNFRRGESALNNSDVSPGLSANPWIRHFRSGSRQQNLASPALREKTKFTTTNHLSACHSHLCHQDSVDSNTEMTDQNFVDDDFAREIASRTCSKKKMKTLAVASSSNDQVVPHVEFPVTEEGITQTCTP